MASRGKKRAPALEPVAEVVTPASTRRYDTRSSSPVKEAFQRPVQGAASRPKDLEPDPRKRKREGPVAPGQREATGSSKVAQRKRDRPQYVELEEVDAEEFEEPVEDITVIIRPSKKRVIESPGEEEEEELRPDTGGYSHSHEDEDDEDALAGELLNGPADSLPSEHDSSERSYDEEVGQPGTPLSQSQGALVFPLYGQAESSRRPQDLSAEASPFSLGLPSTVSSTGRAVQYIAGRKEQASPAASRPPSTSYHSASAAPPARVPNRTTSVGSHSGSVGLPPAASVAPRFTSVAQAAARSASVAPRSTSVAPAAARSASVAPRSASVAPAAARSASVAPRSTSVAPAAARSAPIAPAPSRSISVGPSAPRIHSPPHFSKPKGSKWMSLDYNEDDREGADDGWENRFRDAGVKQQNRPEPERRNLGPTTSRPDSLSLESEAPHSATQGGGRRRKKAEQEPSADGHWLSASDDPDPPPAVEGSDPEDPPRSKLKKKKSKKSKKKDKPQSHQIPDESEEGEEEQLVGPKSKSKFNTSNYQGSEAVIISTAGTCYEVFMMRDMDILDDHLCEVWPDNDLRAKTARNSFKMAVELCPEDWATCKNTLKFNEKARKTIWRGSWILKGRFIRDAKSIVRDWYELKASSKLDRDAAQELIRENVSELLDLTSHPPAMWHRGMCQRIANTPFSHPAISELLWLSLYKKLDHRFWDELRPVTVHAVLLATAALHCAIQCYRHGLFQCVEFTEAAYGGAFWKSLEATWIDFKDASIRRAQGVLCLHTNSIMQRKSGGNLLVNHTAPGPSAPLYVEEFEDPEDLEDPLPW